MSQHQRTTSLEPIVRPGSAQTGNQASRPISPMLDPAVNPSVNQAINQSVTNWLNQHGQNLISDWLNNNVQTITHSIKQSVEQSLKQSIEQSIQQSIKQGLEQSNSQQTSQVDEQSINEQPIGHLLNQRAPLTAPTNPSSNPSNNQPTSQSNNQGRVLGFGPATRRSPSINQTMNQSTADGEFANEVDPRSLLWNRKRLDQSMGGSPSSSNQSITQSPEHHHLTLVERIKESPLTEAGATINQHGTPLIHSPNQPTHQPLRLKANQSPNQTPNQTLTRTAPKTRPVNSSIDQSINQSINDPDVLLVEDVRMSQKIAFAALSRAHYKVAIANDGESAVEMFRNNRSSINQSNNQTNNQGTNSIKIVLMDLGLPGISGIEATERIRAIEQSINQSNNQANQSNEDVEPVMIFGLTGHIDLDRLSDYQKCGMNGIILKGRLIVESIKQSIEQSERFPGEFIVLNETSDSANKSSTNQLSKKTSSVEASSSDQEMKDDDHSHPQSNNQTNNQSSNSSPTHSHSNSQSIDRTTPGQSKSSSPTDASASSSLNQSINQMSLSNSDQSNNQASNQPAPVVTPAYVPGSSPHHGPDLLLVEDVRVSQKLAQQALQRIHFRVEVANDGETAVEKFRINQSMNQSIRVILMDVGLPGISGIEATEKIRAIEREFQATNPSNNQPVLIFGLTGNVDLPNLRAYEQVGMDGCIAKGKLLADAVREALKRKSQGERFVNLVGRYDNNNNQTNGSQANNQTNNQPIAQPVAQSNNQPINQPNDQSPTQAVNPRQLGLGLRSSSSGSSGNQSISRVINQSMQTMEDDDLIAQSLSQSNRSPVNPSLIRSINQSNNQSNDQPRPLQRGILRAGIGLPGASQSSQHSPPHSNQTINPTNNQSNNQTINLTPSPTAMRSVSANSYHGADQNQSVNRSSGPDVLLVEDVRVSQRVAQQALQRIHYRVDTANDGESAVEKFRINQSSNRSLKIVLMDVGLPGISGIEATERIRDIERSINQANNQSDHVLIFGLTGNVGSENVRQYQNAGMDGCIVKGLLLVEAVREAVERCERQPGVFVNLSGSG